MNREEQLAEDFARNTGFEIDSAVEGYKAGYERALADVDAVLNDWIDRELSVGELAMAISKLRGES